MATCTAFHADAGAAPPPAADATAPHAFVDATVPHLVHEDDALVVLHKPPRWLVHRTALDAHAEDDVVNWWRREFGERVWPAHRLDKGTSGLLLLARNATTASRLGQAFAAGQVRKTYLALVRGWPPGTGRTDAPLVRDPEQPSQGQPHLQASTEWTVLQRLSLPLVTRAGFPDTRVAVVEVRPLSGRRHQIRRHFKQMGHPLIGDSTHGKGPLNRAVATWLGHSRLWLHAATLELTHPETGERLMLRAPPGPEWQRLSLPLPETGPTALSETPGRPENP